MDNQPLIDVDRVSKVYCRNMRQSLWYGLKDMGREISGRRRARTKLRAGEFWSLRDVSLKLRAGQSVGLIGRNGAGKTTLLKLINGLIKPDAGSARIRGRIGALIALGSGFEPNLSGRENVYINGSVLGLSRREVRKQFDKIVDFAELEHAIDAPVKTYSSGMKARLGFAVASALDPDVLLIDEVLAVGDFRFQAKCFGRLNDLRESGTAFILVSHSTTSIIQFCQEAIWMDQGRVFRHGSARSVATEYVNWLQEKSNGEDAVYGPTLDDHWNLATADACFEAPTDSDGTAVLHHNQLATIRFCFETRQPLATPMVTFHLHREDGQLITAISTVNHPERLPRSGMVYAGVVEFGPLVLNPGNYMLIANLMNGREKVCRKLAQPFRVAGLDEMTWGLINFKQQWRSSEGSQAQERRISVA